MNVPRDLVDQGIAKPTVILQQVRSATATVERRIVVDGQEWLTTLQLLIDAIQEVLEDQEHPSPAKCLSALGADWCST